MVKAPYRRWTFLGLPVVVWDTTVKPCYLGVLLCGFVWMEASEALTTFGLILMVVAWAAGIAWYLAWAQRNWTQGIDVALAGRDLTSE